MTLFLPQSIQAEFDKLENLIKLEPHVLKEEQAIKKRQQKAFEKLKQQQVHRQALETHFEKKAQQATNLKTTLGDNRKMIAKEKRRLSRNNADEQFSLCVRLRANCTCERCGLPFPLTDMKDLHCSHNYSRDRWQVRYHPDNAFALCRDCHWWFARCKQESTQWLKEKLGKRFDILFQAMASDKSEPSAEEKQKITAWYRITARQLRQLRESGNTDYLPFKGYSQNIFSKS